jgi:hypothetical protein
MRPYNTQNYIANVFPCLATLTICGVLILVIALIGGAVTFTIYSVMALVNNSNNSIQDVCSGSNIWSFLLVVLISGFLQTSQSASSASSESEGAKVISALCFLVVQIGLMVWAGLELWANRCAASSLSDNPVYRMVRIWFIVSASAVSAAFLGIIGIGASMCIRESRAKAKKRSDWVASSLGGESLDDIGNIDGI